MGGKGSSSPPSFAPAPDPGFQQWYSQYRGPSGQRASQQRSRSRSGGGGGGGESSFPSGSRSSSSRSAGSEKYTNWEAVGKEAAKGALVGALFGPGGTAIGATTMALRERARQHGEQNAGPLYGVRNVSPTARKRSGRAVGPARPLSGGDIPMRLGSDYGRYPVSGPPLRRGGSLLTSGDDDEDNGLGGSSITSADLNSFSF